MIRLKVGRSRETVTRTTQYSALREIRGACVFIDRYLGLHRGHRAAHRDHAPEYLDGA